MSGAEALVVLSLVANIADVIDFTCKALKRVQEAKDNTHNLPRAFREIDNSLPLLGNVLKRTEEQINNGALSAETCKAIHPVLQDCFDKVNELNQIFEDCLAKDGSPWLVRKGKALSSLRFDNKIEEALKLIWRNIPLLTYHHVTSPSGAAVVTDPIEKQLDCLHIGPELSSDDFTGREDELRLLKSKLCQTKKHARIAIVGLGGIGKSRLALQTIECYKTTNVSTFWVHAANAARMKAGCREIAKRVGILGWDDSKLDILARIKEWFQSEQSGNWLLVYDNVDDVNLMYDKEGPYLSRYFPRSSRGSILMTSRNRKIGSKFTNANLKDIISLSALSTDESTALMATKLGEHDTEMTQRIKLADILGGIPLALVQAVSFLGENESTSIDRYLEMYEASDTEKMQLLSFDFEDDTRDPEAKNPIATTWAVTFEYLKMYHALAADTLCLMCMFDTHAIPEHFVSDIAQGDPPSLKNVDEALGTLQAYSLIHLGDAKDAKSQSRKLSRNFGLHRLVQLSTRNWLTSNSTYNYWVAEAIKTISSKYKEVKVEGYTSICVARIRYLPHALALTSTTPLLTPNGGVNIPAIFKDQILRDDHAEEGAICPSCTANILAEMHCNNIDPVQNLRMLRKAVMISASTLGQNHAATLRYRSMEAEALWYSENPVEAEKIYRAILSSYDSIYGIDHTESLRNRRNLAGALGDQQKYHDAESELRLSIEACKSCSAQGIDHQNELPRAMQDLATIMALQGRREEAMAMNNDVSKLNLNVVGKFKLAKGYIMLADHIQAESLCQQLLADTPALSQDSFVSVDRVWHLLGKIYRKQKKYNEAETILLQALSYRKEAYGERETSTLYTMLYLADVYYHQNLFDKAEALQLRAIEPLTAILGSSNSEVQEANWDLARIWLKQDKYDQSKRLALEAFTLSRQRAKTLGLKADSQEARFAEALQSVWAVTPDELARHKQP